MPYNPYSEESRRVPVRWLVCGYEWETRADYPRCSDPQTTEISCGKSREWEYQNPGDVPVNQVGTEVDPARDTRDKVIGEPNNKTPIRDSEYAEEYAVDFEPDGDDSDDDEAGDDSGEDTSEATDEIDAEESGEVDAETDEENGENQVLQIDVDNGDSEPDMEAAELEVPDDDPGEPAADDDGSSDEAMVTPQEYDAFHSADPEPDEGDSSTDELDTPTGATDAPMGLPVSRDTLIKVGIIVGVVVVGYVVYTRHIKSSESADGDNPEPTFEGETDDQDERVSDEPRDDPNAAYQTRDEGEIPLFE